MTTALPPALSAVAAAFSKPEDRPVPTGLSASTQASLKATVKGLVQLPEWKEIYTESAVRNLIADAWPRMSSRGVIPGNGLIEAGAIIRIGRRILIDCDRFRTWVESHRISHSALGEHDHERG